MGAVMSICAICVMAILFLSETMAFARTNLVTSIGIDENDAPQIRLNFNITLLDLHCDYVSVDVWDALGTNKQNVTKNVDKWQIDEEGTRRIFSGRNRDVREVAHETHDMTLAQMHEANEGSFLTDLTKDTFDEFMEENPMAFVDMYAPWYVFFVCLYFWLSCPVDIRQSLVSHTVWSLSLSPSLTRCVWCQRLAPTWEKFAEEVEKLDMPVGVAKIDCVAEADLCREQKVMAFPTLRWYHEGKAVPPDYKMDRTVTALTGYAKRKLEMDEKYKEWESKSGDRVTPEEKERKQNLYRQQRTEHPGCQVSGHLMVNRVPGNFHIEAKSVNHNLNAAMTNLSHVVNHLSFGEPLDVKNRKAKRILKQVPDEHQQFQPMDGQDYVTRDYHQAFHHYIKVVSTHLNMGSSDSSMMLTYQFLEQSQVVYYETVNVPEARFSYDLSPMSVVVEKQGRKWYDYLTSLCAIIGGTFTTLGLIDATLYKILKPKKL